MVPPFRRPAIFGSVAGERHRDSHHRLECSVTNGNSIVSEVAMEKDVWFCRHWAAVVLQDLLRTIQANLNKALRNERQDAAKTDFTEFCYSAPGQVALDDGPQRAGSKQVCLMALCP